MVLHRPLAPDGHLARLRPVEGAVPCAVASRPWVLAATILGSAMAFIDGSVVNIALPVIQRELGAGIGALQWVVNGYTLFLGALLLVGGAAGDRYGRRAVFVAGTAVFAAASLACALAPGLPALLAARAAQGIGAALLVPQSLAIISAAFPADIRGRAIGTWAGAASLTTAFGPALGGFLVDGLGWRAAFWINLPLAVAGGRARAAPCAREPGDDDGTARLEGRRPRRRRLGAGDAWPDGARRPRWRRLERGAADRRRRRGGRPLRPCRGARRRAAGAPVAVPEPRLHGCQPADALPLWRIDRHTLPRAVRADRPARLERRRDRPRAPARSASSSAASRARQGRSPTATACAASSSPARCSWRSPPLWLAPARGGVAVSVVAPLVVLAARHGARRRATDHRGDERRARCARRRRLGRQQRREPARRALRDRRRGGGRLDRLRDGGGAGRTLRCLPRSGLRRLRRRRRPPSAAPMQPA